MDIKGFFDNLDHERLRQTWSDLAKVKALPPDHQAVFKAVTRYAKVDKIEVYRRLGFFGSKGTYGGRSVDGYLVGYKDIPRQLCSGRDFRLKIAGGSGQPSLVRVNKKPFGVPQGAPISDLLANAYLFDFDVAMVLLLKKLGGVYHRYSDDILLIAPGDGQLGSELMKQAQCLIKTTGKKLAIQEAKSSIFEFGVSNGKQTYKKVFGKAGRNGLEYLGFRFDGKCVYLRDSTISNLNRKIAKTTRNLARYLVAKNPKMSASFFKVSKFSNLAIQKFGKVRDFRDVSRDPKK